jgi:Ion channel
MGVNLLIGLSTMITCLLIQGVVVGILLRVSFVLEAKHLVQTSFFRTTVFLVAAMVTMLGGNLLQMTIWAGLFVACGAFGDFSVAFYHSVVNFTTLGYGDLVMTEQWRLLGALEAANGVLMLGLTASVLFLVISVLMRREWDRLARKDPKSDTHSKETAGVPPPSGLDPTDLSR